ncbi:hypothetical protein [Kitasatospora sp. GP82]|uniref:hypothetical protein n=1 Tax=Kitasatospora sp. GP82 TaxID=3035089 RepID=UPI002476A04A|nr:hypothetical protein [Kitasatospora sp. GP82]MDH6128283.1 hypothetical protein [Kitasatospora sp. GP82]
MAGVVDDDQQPVAVAALAGPSGAQAREALALELLWWGAPALDDPGTGELAHLARICAIDRSRAADPRMRAAADLLHQAADVLDAADRLRCALRPVVSHHLRHAHHLAVQARTRLTCAVGLPLPLQVPGGPAVRAAAGCRVTG